jgi:hypothetical protein
VKTVKDYILIALLGVGVAVVALMYSPVGSPHLYHNMDRISVGSSVQFYGKIENAPRQSATSAHAHTPFDNAMVSTSTINFGSSSPSSSLGSTSGNHSSHYALGMSHSIYTLKSTGGGGGGADMAFSSGGKRDNENGEGISLGAFAMPKSSSSSSFASSSPFSPKITAPYASDQGGMDPGADPTGLPLPLENDALILTVCVIIYFALKKYKCLVE